MLWIPAEKNGSCAACLDIARQLNEASADDRSKAGGNAPSRSTDTGQTQAALDALHALIGGTEEDAERADELLDRYHHQAQSYQLHGLTQLSPRFVTALRRAVQHAAQAGHWLRKIAG